MRVITPRVGTAPYLKNTSTGQLSGWPLAFAHRGFSPSGAENTMAAFAAAVELGFGYLETDVRTSADGVLVVFHDETVDRVTDGTGKVSDLSLEQLRTLRVAGREQIPTFDELLSAWPDIRLNVDAKDECSATLLARAIERHGAHDRVLVASFDEARSRFALAAMGRPVAWSSGSATAALAVALGALGLHRLIRSRLSRTTALQVPVRQGPFRVITPGFIRRAHAAGVQVHAWVIDDQQQMRELLEMGVDGLMSDRADLLAAVMAERGTWPQRN
ncbi:glycerophosphodiester phosphodiesterase [Paeniglutamicibacter cryotolerans]|uniref:glycerophosphodiester phosphodiesterase n=1 Tax=Paeniglutamicibacter cryotolerans TaxID=670079 RepID=UPI0038995509